MNNIREINGSEFSDLRRPSRLNLKDNLLIFPPPLTFVRTSLTYLDLSWNQISHISKSYFHGCVKLNKLILDRNKLTEIPNIEFVADVVQHIELSGNEIDDAVAFYGRKYHKLETLKLEVNILKIVCLPTEEVAHRLYDVGLRSNNLTSVRLPLDLRDITIKLAGNPWHCDWSLNWVYKCSFIDELRLRCTQGVFLIGFTCVSPANPNGESPWQVGKNLWWVKNIIAMTLLSKWHHHVVLV